MQGDFSRISFDPGRHFSAVLSQQGRLQVDAEQNEQVAIAAHRLRTVLTDLIGPAGVPAGAAGGFAIGTDGDGDGEDGLPDLTVGTGRMYVDGILVENDGPATTYWNQPDGFLDPDRVADRLPERAGYLVYLRVWERFVTALEDPSIREIALGELAPDTAARTRVVWQVAAVTGTALPAAPTPAEAAEYLRLRFRRPAGALPRLQVRARRPTDGADDPCDISPESRYRGPENQLYRVQVHRGGAAGATASFAWSRENASVLLPVISVAGSVVELATLGRDGKLGVDVGDWVEVLDDATVSRVAEQATAEVVPRLRRVRAVDPAARQVTLSGAAEPDPAAGDDPARHPVLRRWDHRSPTATSGGPVQIGTDGAVPVVEGAWIDLEDGIQVRFVPGSADTASPVYHRGDYWVFPARVIPGDVRWPRAGDGPAARPPDGIAYHHAPLAFVGADGTTTDLRLTFVPLTAVPPRGTGPTPAGRSAGARRAARSTPTAGASGTGGAAETSSAAGTGGAGGEPGSGSGGTDGGAPARPARRGTRRGTAKKD